MSQRSWAFVLRWISQGRNRFVSVGWMFFWAVNDICRYWSVGLDGTWWGLFVISTYFSLGLVLEYLFNPGATTSRTGSQVSSWDCTSVGRIALAARMDRSWISIINCRIHQRKPSKSSSSGWLFVDKKSQQWPYWYREQCFWRRDSLREHLACTQCGWSADKRNNRTKGIPNQLIKKMGILRMMTPCVGPVVERRQSRLVVTDE